MVTSALPYAVRCDFDRLLSLIGSRQEELLALTDDDSLHQSDDPLRLDRLCDWLYATWYSVPDPAPLPSRCLRSGDLASALRSSLPGSTSWQDGWVAMRCDRSGRCIAGREGQIRDLLPGDYANISRPGVPPQPGDHIVIAKRIDWVDQSTAFWGAQAIAGEPHGPLVRLYFSVDSVHIGTVLNEVATILDRLAVKYSLKCPLRSSDYCRVDTLILYLEKDSWESAAPTICAFASSLEVYLRDSVPPLTLKIAQGVGFAEDPGGSESFGQSRCRYLASAVLEIIKHPDASRTNNLQLLANALEASGIDPNQPWLGGAK